MKKQLILIALACAFGVWWLLNRTTTGFEFRSVGANPSAARVAAGRSEQRYECLDEGVERHRQRLPPSGDQVGPTSGELGPVPPAHACDAPSIVTNRTSVVPLHGVHVVVVSAPAVETVG